MRSGGRSVSKFDPLGRGDLNVLKSIYAEVDQPLIAVTYLPRDGSRSLAAGWSCGVDEPSVALTHLFTKLLERQRLSMVLLAERRLGLFWPLLKVQLGQPDE